MKTGKAAKRRQRERKALLLAIGSAAAILALASVVAVLVYSQVEQRRRVGGPFTLVAHTGQVVTDRSFPGKYLAIYFGYTHCQDVCPATLTNLTAALARLGQTAGRVQPLFITVDPQRDSPAVLRHYVANFAPGLLGLTGTDTALGQLDEAFHMTIFSHRQPTATANYPVDHSSVIYLMDPAGSFIAAIPANASEMVMAQALTRYMRVF